MNDYLSIARQILDRRYASERSELREECASGGGVSSPISLNSPLIGADVDWKDRAAPVFSDRSTWPPYLHKLEEETKVNFGDEAARRQIDAEIAFLREAAAQGWVVLGWGLLGAECDAT